ncbi:MAG: hypothetical protein LBH29_00675 [Elusimicrobiota bacterium]|nr:hypothetical protein [Elusimicrobiota bacterium]
MIFASTSKIANFIAQISEQIDKIQASGEYERNLQLRKANRLRSTETIVKLKPNYLAKSPAEIKAILKS